VHLVQAYGRERFEDRRFAAGAETLYAAGRRANELQAQFSPVLTVSVAIATASITWYGATKVLAGSMTAGELLVFLAYFRALATPVRRVAKTSRVVGRAAIALDRIGDYLLEKPTVADRPGAIAPRRCSGVVAFEQVGFHYAAERRVLEDISFTLTPGRTVALIGPTGAGKSTISAMIPRLHDPTEGRVLLDGRDLRDLKLSFIRGHVAVVLQESMLFRATVWENICYGREGSSREDAVAAAKAGGVHDLISALPGGYELVISERGQTLSGGQRQCVSIARAMLSNAPVVILDEPSSNLDAATEQQLMTAIAHLTADRSALVIAHRLRTVASADEILVLDHGRIRPRGRHDALVREDGLYARLWRSAGGEVAAAMRRESA
jgi:ATP-binding cassette subfamily B protein/subfamily B ATP-binding cassette protein MsbA